MIETTQHDSDGAHKEVKRLEKSSVEEKDISPESNIPHPENTRIM